MRASPGRKCKRAAVACRAENKPCEDRFSGNGSSLKLAPALPPILPDHYHRYRVPRQLESGEVVVILIFWEGTPSLPLPDRPRFVLAACPSGLGKRYGMRCGPLRLADRTRVGRS